MPRFALSLGAALGLIASGCGGAPALPLAIVAARNAADLVHRLLLERHDPNERDANGLTPLMWAARSGAVEAMAAPISRRATTRTDGRRCSMRSMCASPRPSGCFSTGAPIRTRPLTG